MHDSRVPVRIPGSVEADVDGERVLLSPKDFSYFGAEGAGADVWDLIDGSRSVDDIVAELQLRYDGEPDVIRAETAEFLTALAHAGLIDGLTHR